MSIGFFATAMKKLIDTVGGIARVYAAHADRERRRFDIHQRCSRLVSEVATTMI
jgi:hypothetical protein